MFRKKIVRQVILLFGLLSTIPLYFIYAGLLNQQVLIHMKSINFSNVTVFNESTKKVPIEKVEMTTQPVLEDCPDISNLLIGELSIYLSG